MVQEEGSQRPEKLTVPFSEFDPKMAVEVLGALWDDTPRGGSLTPKGYDPKFWDLIKTAPDLIGKEGIVRVQVKEGAVVELLSPNRKRVAGIPNASEVVFDFGEGSITFRNGEGDSYVITNKGQKHEIINHGQGSQAFHLPIDYIYG